MIRYRFLSIVEEEIAESIEYYEEREPGFYIEFLKELSRIIGILRNSPLIGQTTFDEFRSFPLSRFPFSVVYKVEGEELVIFAVAHQSRRPDYWKDRVS